MSRITFLQDSNRVERKQRTKRLQAGRGLFARSQRRKFNVASGDSMFEF